MLGTGKEGLKIKAYFRKSYDLQKQILKAKYCDLRGVLHIVNVN